MSGNGKRHSCLVNVRSTAKSGTAVCAGNGGQQLFQSNCQCIVTSIVASCCTLLVLCTAAQQWPAVVRWLCIDQLRPAGADLWRVPAGPISQHCHKCSVQTPQHSPGAATRIHFLARTCNQTTWLSFHMPPFSMNGTAGKDSLLQARANTCKPTAIMAIPSGL